MAAQRGKDLLVKVEASAGVWQTVAGLRARRIAFNAETVDVTTAESAGRWRELLGGAGVQRASVSGSGIFKDAASDAAIRSMFFESRVAALQVVVPDFGTVSGPFQVTALEYGGEHDGEVTFEATLESAGALAFAAA
jgi:TP901-1 family phage major tail protein